MKLLILFEELSGYFLACVDRLISEYATEVIIIHKPVNPEAPFKFNLNPNIHFYDRSTQSEEALIDLAQTINPDAILCGGWSNRTYMKICKSYRRRIPVILGFDNQWKGTIKQHLAGFLAPVLIQPAFNTCFVPGSLQKKFARKLGFPEQRIFEGIYSADQPFFSAVYERQFHLKQTNFPKRFMYAGRYVPEKGIRILWEVFSELKEEGNLDWELWCLGTGPEKPRQHPCIRHFGFVQPENLPELMAQAGVFVMPSLFEPWGVVLHEFAAAGFPIVCSDSVGASEIFLQDSYNGFIYRSEDPKALKNALRKVMNLNTIELMEMSRRSVELSRRITPASWASTVLKMMQLKP